MSFEKKLILCALPHGSFNVLFIFVHFKECHCRKLRIYFVLSSSSEAAALIAVQRLWSRQWNYRYRRIAEFCCWCHCSVANMISISYYILSDVINSYRSIILTSFCNFPRICIFFGFCLSRNLPRMKWNLDEDAASFARSMATSSGSTNWSWIH